MDVNEAYVALMARQVSPQEAFVAGWSTCDQLLKARIAVLEQKLEDENNKI